MKKEFDKPFSERLKAELDNSENEYTKNDKNFAINISSPSTVLFQIISSIMLESNDDLQPGFGLHLSFDDSFEEGLVEIEKFKDQTYSTDFVFHNLDDIPTYQIHLGVDKERIDNLVKRIISDVYEKNVETIDIDSFEI